METKKTTTKMTPRKLKSFKTRKKIYDAALALFLEKGFNEVTVDEIVAQTGTSKGAFYNHFKSKNDLIVEKLKEFDGYCLQLQKNFSYYSSAKERLLAFIEIAGTFPEAKGYSIDLIKVIYSSQIKLSGKEEPFLIQKNRPSRILLKEIIEQGQNSGEITKKFSSYYIAEIIDRSIRGTMIDWCLYNGKYNYLKSLQKYLFNIVFPSIFVKTNRNLLL